MNAVKHTPGPWTFDGPSHSIIVWGPTPELRVCFMTSDGPAKANARLIAAAPAMLEALKEMRGMFTDEGHMLCGGELRAEILGNTDAAIAKAEGRS